MTDDKAIQKRLAERIIVALDVAHEKEAKELLARLEGQACFVKVGMELYYATGRSFIEYLKRQDWKIFLDLKLHDIPQTVGRTMSLLTRLGVDMTNLHAAGGFNMMQAAREEMEKALVSGQAKPSLIAVTQLTSTDEKVLNEEIGIPGSVEQAVLHYAALAKQAGLDGVVASPLEVPRLKEKLGSRWVTVTPGIRPVGSESGDQRRITTPREAFQLGSDYIVVGRPVTRAPDPGAAFASILRELAEER